MFDLSETDVVIEQCCGDRSIVSGSDKTVDKQDRRRSFGINPNSRQQNNTATNSYSQDGDISMIDSMTTFVGIDVSKDSLDVCVPQAQEALGKRADEQ